MQLPSHIKFADEKIKAAFESLEQGKTEEQQLYRRLVRAFQDIEKNAFCGIQIPKRLIPKKLLQRYNLTNLWKYNLPDAWRLLYSIENNQLIVVSVILAWIPHKTYDHLFHY